MHAASRAGATDFRLYHSNALEVLAGLLGAELRTPLPGHSPLTPETVLIPQAAMRRWLQATLAAAHGVVANLEFLTPGEFVARALDANPEADAEACAGDLDAAALRWRLYAALTDPALIARPALAQLAAYLRDGDALKPWTLAGELAATFEKYQAWRRDWLLRWDAGGDRDDPQAILWRRIIAGRRSRARRIHDYLARYEGEGRALPQGLPPRLFAFAPLNVSPDVLRVIATQARVGTLHFYLPTPSKAYWGDLQTLAEKLRAGVADPFAPADADGGAGAESSAGGDDNPLLQAWGAAGRDFVALLGGYEVVHPSGEIAAYADPEHDARPPLAAGGLGDGLLQRLQRDLFHRRPPPPAAPTAADPRTRLPALRRHDPSLQVHACHTRLRELQVLHDQLRGLLEDARFEPPLQPREIAVLAPDIDPYVPYLEAVFGDDEARIPYALADSSPLAGEPLAAVFLQLLGLPLSRFGRGEILDLLASAPLAAAAGLDPAALERLRTWLDAAGARWGLDAAHRAAHQAPEDDAYTWQFALDRLLLGHASGGEDEIAGVAPWPELEGGALAALDTLIRLLRVLARQRAALAEALPPAQWRERLLALLAALLPAEPAQAAERRALERLRGLINAFADEAERAGYDGPVPAEVVRAHFAAVLAEADTRAPLLTGGVSFGRMVPMRLLPFRVICVLGLDDGEYPRRDPAAGLNRLTAELGSERRRRGDRSLRDDDRFLFLQLFAAAQDVFYVSYLGADPREGGVREPSPLVAELIETAAQYHADPEAARAALVLRHPLQPFAPAAFGGEGEPRRFSYRGAWQRAAQRIAGARAPLPPWFDGAALTAAGDDDAAEPALSLEALRRFLLAPAEAFLQQRLGLRLAEIDAAAHDVEPLLAPARGRARAQLQRAVFEALLREEPDAVLQRRLRARGLLPSGALGRRVLAALRETLTPYARAFADWRGEDGAEALRVDVDVGGTRVHGRIADAYRGGIARLRFDPPNGPSAIRNGLDWLLASAVGAALPLVEFHDAGELGLGPHARGPLPPAQAQAALRGLLALRARGLREPLPFAPYSGWALYAADTLERGLQAAAAIWRGGERQWSEGDGAALRLALRGRDPFADAPTRRDFVALALSIYGAVTAGQPEAGATVASDDLATVFDPEDAA